VTRKGLASQKREKSGGFGPISGGGDRQGRRIWYWARDAYTEKISTHHSGGEIWCAEKVLLASSLWL